MSATCQEAYDRALAEKQINIINKCYPNMSNGLSIPKEPEFKLDTEMLDKLIDITDFEALSRIVKDKDILHESMDTALKVTNFVLKGLRDA